jgi:transposase
VKELEALVALLMAEVQDLKTQLARDSQTSSQPPSRDKPWKSKSERSSSGKTTGGQVGHPGKTLTMSEQIDEVVVLPLTGRCGCGQAWEQVSAQEYLARQVHDLPEIRLQVTEYQAEVKVCPHCATRGQAAFPSHVSGQVQYGPQFHGLSTYLNTAHFIPLKRTCEIMEALCGATPSDGTVALNLKLASQRLEGFEGHLKTALLEQDVLNADETGSKVNGKMHWLHVVSNAHFTLYGHHPKRGFEALEDLGVLNTFKGIVMHDCWTSYFKLSATHALCNAHLLRELRGLAEHHGQIWAGELRLALQGVYHQYKSGSLTPEGKARFHTRFDTLLEAGLAENPALEPVPNKRGRVKQTPARNLALRCQQHKEDYLRFLEDKRVPFDNNGAERDIRMTCIKRKVSGGFRSDAGGETFCRIRSYISTLKKQGLNVWHGLTSIFSGNLMMPDFSR